MTIRGNMLRKIEDCKAHAVDIALKAGLIEGHRHYQKFIILWNGPNRLKYVSHFFKVA